jgi:hypothetical protein
VRWVRKLLLSQSTEVMTNNRLTTSPTRSEINATSSQAESQGGLNNEAAAVSIYKSPTNNRLITSPTRSEINATGSQAESQGGLNNEASAVSIYKSPTNNRLITSPTCSEINATDGRYYIINLEHSRYEIYGFHKPGSNDTAVKATPM